MLPSFSEFKARVLAALDEKVDLSEVQTALNSSQSDLSARFQEYKEDIKALFRTHEADCFALLNKKANLTDVNAALAAKADNGVVQNILNSKVGSGEFENLRKILEEISI